MAKPRLFPADNTPAVGGGIINNTAIHSHGAYAYFPGSGPAGKRCFECQHFAAATETCLKYKSLRDSATETTPPKINPGAAACKYFAPIPK